METKICTHCGIEKPITEFYRSKKREGNYTQWCKDCLNLNHGMQKIMDTTKRNPLLKSFTDTLLLDELKARGYKEKLSKVQTDIKL